jgi:putative ABC transport system permease protein
VADAREGNLVQQAKPEAYFSMWQVNAFTKHLVIRVKSNPRSLAPTVERELRAIEPSVAIEHVKTLEQIRAESVATQTLAMRLLVGFALVGSVLALVGIYGVLSLSVGSRRREIAIRMAVGAQRSQVIRLILREGWMLIGLGLVIGTTLALVLARGLRTFLFGVEPADPLTFVGVAILFSAVALLACYIPARRATRIEPMNALRCE